MQISISNMKVILLCFTIHSTYLAALDASWSSPPTNLSPLMDTSESPSIVLAGSRGVSIWIDQTTSEIQGSVLDYANHTWTSTSTLSNPDDNPSNPKLAIDSSGNAIAVWLNLAEDRKVIYAAKLAANTTTWIPTSAVPLAPQENVLDISVGKDNLGNTVLVWSSTTSGVRAVKAAKNKVGEGVWTAATAPLATGDLFYFHPDIAVSTAGKAVAVWRNALGSIQGSTAALGSNTWTATSDIPALLFGLKPKVAIGSAGIATVIYSAYDSKVFQIRAATLAASSNTWIATTPPPQDSSSYNFYPQIAVDHNQTAIAVWSSNNRIVSASLLSGRSTWIAPESGALSNFGGLNPDIAIDSDGNAFAAWRYFTQRKACIQVAFKEAGTNEWVTYPDLLSSVNSFMPQIAASATEAAVVVWQTSNLIQASTTIP